MFSRLALVLFFLACQAAPAEVLFEAFYRIEKGAKHIGYLVQRMSRAPQTSSRTLVTFVHTAFDGNQFFETTKSVAKEDGLLPVESFQGGNAAGSRKETHAFFTGDKAWVEVTNPKGRKALIKNSIDIKKTPFQSEFLFYKADLEKLEKGRNYEFDAYAERAGRAAYGQLSLESELKVGSQKVQQIVVTYLGQTAENFVSILGEPLGARSPADGTVVYWVKTKEAAIGSLEYPSRDLISLFGDLPEGKKNSWYEMAGLDARNFIMSVRKSFGLRKLAFKEREKIKSPLPIRKGRIL